MNYTGFKKRSLATQQNFIFNNNLNVDIATGFWEFGFSGASGTLRWYGNSGNIYDPYSGVVGFYRENTSFSISGYVGQSIYGYYIDEVETRIGGAKFNGYTDHIYHNCSNCTLASDLSIIGEIPDYRIEYNPYRYTGVYVTGYIYNDEMEVDKKFRIFSGGFTDTTKDFWQLLSHPTGDISGGGSGDFIFNVNNRGGGIDIPNSNNLRLYTNFGIVDKPITTYTSDPALLFSSLDLINSGILHTTTSNVSILQYILTTNIPTGVDVGISLTNQFFQGHTTGYVDSSTNSVLSSWLTYTGYDPAYNNNTPLAYYAGYRSGATTIEPRSRNKDRLTYITLKRVRPEVGATGTQYFSWGDRCTLSITGEYGVNHSSIITLTGGVGIPE